MNPASQSSALARSRARTAATVDGGGVHAKVSDTAEWRACLRQSSSSSAGSARRPRTSAVKHSPSVSRVAPAPDYHPANVFAYPPNLSRNVQRVAVLPLASVAAAGDLPEGCEALTSVLWDQLVKTKKFEVVPVPPDRLRSRTGRPAAAVFFKCEGVKVGEDAGKRAKQSPSGYRGNFVLNARIV